jgi:hypothetical protein
MNRFSENPHKIGVISIFLFSRLSLYIYIYIKIYAHTIYLFLSFPSFISFLLVISPYSFPFLFISSNTNANQKTNFTSPAQHVISPRTEHADGRTDVHNLAMKFLCVHFSQSGQRTHRKFSFLVFSKHVSN